MMKRRGFLRAVLGAGAALMGMPAALAKPPMAQPRAVNTVATLNGIFKQRYAGAVKNVLPAASAHVLYKGHTWYVPLRKESSWGDEVKGPHDRGPR